MARTQRPLTRVPKGKLAKSRGHVTMVNEIPLCDCCKKRLALVDALIRAFGGPTWGYMCKVCWPLRGYQPGSTGTGVGQYLVTPAELKEYREWEQGGATGTGMSFEAWLKDVDGMLEDLYGVSYLDLADQPYRDWYDSGMSVKKAIASLQDEDDMLSAFAE